MRNPLDKESQLVPAAARIFWAAVSREYLKVDAGLSLRGEGRCVRLHQAMQPRLFPTVALVANRGAILRAVGLPVQWLGRKALEVEASDGLKPHVAP